MFEVQIHSFKPAGWWHSQRAQIDMEPDYQRQGGIWTKDDRSFLIDSIINDYDMPKLYFADFTALATSINVAKKLYAVIDGKQRLQAVFSYLDDQLPLAKETKFLGPPLIELGGYYWSDLQRAFPDLAAKIFEFPLPVMHVVTDDITRINELFLRLNKGTALSVAERRSAMAGPLPRVIRRIANHAFFLTRVRYRQERGQSLNAAAKILKFEIDGELTDTQKEDLDDMVKNYSNEDLQKFSPICERVADVLDRMCKVFDEKDTLLGNEGQIPVYYWLVRELGTTDESLRTLLFEFEKGLKEVGDLDVGEPTQYFAGYKKAMRNTNDKHSYQIRFNTLKQLYRNRIIKNL